MKLLYILTSVFCFKIIHSSDEINFSNLLLSNNLIPDLLNSPLIDFLSTISKSCKEDISYFRQDFYANKEWPLQMLDASAKLPSSLSRGSRWWYGFPDDCNFIESTLPNEKVIYGKYGLLTLSTKNILNITNLFPNSIIYAGICLPSGCNETDGYFLSIHAPSKVVLSLGLKIINYNYEYVPPDKMDTLTLFTIWFCVLILILIIFGTVFDYIINSKSNTSEKLIYDTTKPKEITYDTLGCLKTIVLCFSLYRNGAAFFNTDNSDSFPCLYGIRFFSMVWILLHHTIKFMEEFDNSNSVIFSPSIWSGLFSKGDIAVSNFFVLSSLLLSFNFFHRDITQQAGFSWLKFYITRLWRLSPVYYLCFVLSNTILMYFGGGFFWPPYILLACRQVWWMHFLYINNLFSSDTLNNCWSHSWYLCVEVQLFLLSPLIMMALMRSQRFGLTVIFISMSSCIIIVFVWLCIEGDNMMEIRSGFPKLCLSIYTKPIVYAPSYMIGILLGYFIFKTKCQPIKKKWFYILIWIIVITQSCVTLIGSGTLNDIHHFKFIQVIYYTFHRVLWSLGTALGIYCCLVGYGGCINTFLSMKIWMPLSRLTYCAYLTHIYFTEVYFKNNLTVINFTEVQKMSTYLWILIVTCVFSFIITLSFELPLLNLEKLLTKKIQNNLIKKN